MNYQQREPKKEEESIFKTIWNHPLYRLYLIICFMPLSMIYVIAYRNKLFGPTRIFGIEVEPVGQSKYEGLIPERKTRVVSASVKSEANLTRKTQQKRKTKPTRKMPTYQDKLVELRAMPGMGSVATQLEDLVDFLEVQKRRERAGFKVRGISLHTIFKGPPGTGKTTVARIYGEVLGILGILKSGHVVEVSRPELIGRYVGETSEKTSEVIDDALDGVLFIDEAYSLTRSGSDGDFGPEAVDCLIKRMEDERDRLVVIIAGYAKDIDKFLQTNEGMKSRFSRELVFEPYDAEALVQIFQYIAGEAEYTLHPDVIPRLAPIFERERGQTGFGNARFARTYFEKVVQNHAKRIAKLVKVKDLDLEQILVEDLG